MPVYPLQNPISVKLFMKGWKYVEKPAGDMDILIIQAFLL